MTTKRTPEDKADADEFARAGREARPSLLAEFWDFLKTNKKWWLLPILVFMLAMGVLIALASNPVTAPLMYPFW